MDEAVCISHSANTFGKDMNPAILPSVMGKEYDRFSSLILVWQLVKEKENSEFKPVKLIALKLILCCTLLVADGLVHTYIHWYIHT